nr:MAG TPA: hypothetical protein [Bacteriophage sp.]
MRNVLPLSDSSATASHCFVLGCTPQASPFSTEIKQPSEPLPDKELFYCRKVRHRTERRNYI